MGLLTSNVSRLRNDPRLLRLPPYLALLCILGGIAWVLLLPLNEYSRRTYISENALLPGQVHTYFQGSEQNIFRAYRHEVASVLEPKAIEDENGNPTGNYLVATDGHRIEKLDGILKDAGLKTARQRYEFESAGQTFTGENLYTIVHGPRADGTESIVLVAPIRNAKNEHNVRGVTLLLTLARYFSRWSLWSKDIILVVTPDTSAGPQAFVDAYHSMHDPRKVADLSLKSGHIQGAVVIDFPIDHNFETLHLSYDGVNGQLPNLDLINTAIKITTDQMGIASTIQSQHEYTPSEHHAQYLVRLKTLGHGMLNQALGHSTGAHSVFMPYHIDAVTLTAIGHGWQDEMAFGRTVESIVRSLNNLLEKLHQSFFFYLMLQNIRFVSIGTYLPSAMAIGASFTILAIFGWVSSGYEEVSVSSVKKFEGKSSTDDKQLPEDLVGEEKTVVRNDIKGNTATTAWKSIDRPLVVPVAVVSALHLTSILSISLLSNIRVENLLTAAISRSVVTFAAPLLIALALKQYTATATSANYVTVNTVQKPPDDISLASTPRAVSKQMYTLLSSLALLILGLELTVLATLNFSLSMFIGILCTPAAFTGYFPSSLPSLLDQSSAGNKSTKVTGNGIRLTKSLLSVIALTIFSPPSITLLATIADLYYFEPFRAPIGIMGRIKEFLEEESFAVNVLGAWGVNVGIWAVWVPAWTVAFAGVWATLLDCLAADQHKSADGHGGVEKTTNVKINDEKVKANQKERVSTTTPTSKTKKGVGNGSGNGSGRDQKASRKQ